MTSLAPTAPLTGAPEPPTADPTEESQPAAAYRDGPGDLRIDARVVRRLAAWAANEVDGVGGASAGPIGRAIHHPVPASTTISQLSLDLDLTVSIEYPQSVRVTVERLATHVARRVEELTGRPVRDISVHVEHLTSPHRPARPAGEGDRSGRVR